MLSIFWSRSQSGNGNSSKSRKQMKRPLRRARLRGEFLETRHMLSMAPNVLVNNPAEDPTPPSYNTQSETSTIAFGSTELVAFNDSGSNYSDPTKFTGYARSTDGGQTFTDMGTLPTNSMGDAGDPTLARDSSNGNVYLSTLTYSSAGIDVFKSTDGGQTFSLPVNSAPGVSGELDKSWLTVDNYSGAGQGNVYQTFTDFGTTTSIYLTRSTDGGSSWGPNRGVLIASGIVQGSNVVVGPDHSVYVFWLDDNQSAYRILMRKSSDDGLTFAPAVTVATLNTTGLYNGDLGLTAPGHTQGFRTNTFPQAAVNPVNGDIYVTFDDKGAGTDRADIFFTQSSDGGNSFSPVVKLNDDGTSNDQWQPAISVTPDGTHVFVGFYDRRLDPSNANIDTWGVIGVDSTPSTSHSIVFENNFRITTQSFAAVYGSDSVVNSTYMGD